MNTPATPRQTVSGDEAWLESLFEKIDLSPAAILRTALRFVAHHSGHEELKPQLMVLALKSRGEQQALTWLAKLEPTLGIQDFMRRSGLSKSGVHKAKEENRILAIRLTGERFDRFPQFQLKDGKVREWLPEILASTGNGLAAAHFLAVSRKHLKGRAWLDLVGEDEPHAVAAMLRHVDSIGDEARGVEPGLSPVPLD